MNVKTLVYLVVILIVINIAALGTIVYERINARPERPFFPMPGDQMDAPGMMLPKSLDLSPEQFQTLHESRQRLTDMMAASHEQLRTKRQELFDEIGKPDPDTQVVFRLVEEIGRIQTEMQKQAVENILKDKAVLSPEQRELLLREIQRRSFDRAKLMFDRSEDKRDRRRGDSRGGF